jgi:outer membrane protein TolC
MIHALRYLMRRIFPLVAVAPAWLVLFALAPAAAWAQPVASSAEVAQPVPPLPPALALIMLALAPQPGGLTGETVGMRAAATSFSAVAAAEQVRAAAARVDQSWAGFLPRLTVNAQYTRLSSFTAPTFGGGPAGIYSVVSSQPPGTINPTDTVVAPAAQGFAFPLVLNQWTLQAQIAVPISDYFLRINQGYTAATHAQEAARHDLLTLRARSATEAIIAFYNDIRARGGAAVAEQALVNVKAHAVDAENQFKVGNASRADVLRAETQIAAAELTVARMKNLVSLLDKQVRTALHAKEGEFSTSGEDFANPPSPPAGELKTYVGQALAARPELKSFDANLAALRKTAGIARAGNYPRVTAFGEATVANPNPRRVPQTADWFPSWSVGLQASWSPNDVLTAQPAAREADARIAALEAQRTQLGESIELEVTQALQTFTESKVELETTRRQILTATEAHRVAHELFVNGRATATLVIDAETELTRARLEAVNANLDAFVARTRFEHALGRDLRYAGPEATAVPRP